VVAGCGRGRSPTGEGLARVGDAGVGSVPAGGVMSPWIGSALSVAGVTLAGWFRIVAGQML
jgi:hypothetical protein